MKLLLKILAGLITLLILDIAAIFILVDPNEFKPEIEQAARDSANIELQLDGEISLSIFPSIGLQLGKTAISVVGDKQSFASLNNIDIGVQLLPLLKGELAVSSLLLQDLVLNLHTDKKGANNWDKLGPQPASTSSVTTTTASSNPADTAVQDTPQESGQLPAIFVPRLDIINANINYKSEKDNAEYIIEQFNLAGTDISLTEPFELTTDFKFKDNTGIKTASSISTKIQLNLADEKHTISEIKLDSSIDGVLLKPLTIDLSINNILADIKADNVTISGLSLNTLSTSTLMNLKVEHMSGKPALSGDLVVNEFDLNSMLKAMGEAPVETTDPEALKRIKLTADIGGPANSFFLQNMLINLDDTTIKGKAGIQNLDTQAIKFDLLMSQMNVDRYLPPVTEAEPEAEEQASQEAAQSKTASTSKKTKQAGNVAEEQLIPVETLLPLIVNGTFKIEKLIASEIPVENIEFAISAKGGMIGISKLDGQVLNGTFSHEIILDVTGKKPQINFDQEISNVEIGPVITSLAGKEIFSGAISSKSGLHLSGNSETEFINSLKGPSDFSLKKATFHGGNLESMVSDGLKAFAGDYAWLIPDISGKVSKNVEGETKLLNVTVKNSFNSGLVETTLFRATLEKGSVSGNGKFNIKAESFDYDINLVHPDIGNQQYFAGTAWPLKCKGKLSDSASKWCGVDKKGMKTLFKKTAKKAGKQRLKDEAAKKLGLDSLEKDALKKKAKEEAAKEIKKALQNKLKGLF